MIAAGRRSKTDATAVSIVSRGTVSVSNVSTLTDTGRATPIA